MEEFEVETSFATRYPLDERMASFMRTILEKWCWVPSQILHASEVWYFFSCFRSPVFWPCHCLPIFQGMLGSALLQLVDDLRRTSNKTPKRLIWNFQRCFDTPPANSEVPVSTATRQPLHRFLGPKGFRCKKGTVIMPRMHCSLPNLYLHADQCRSLNQDQAAAASCRSRYLRSPPHSQVQFSRTRRWPRVSRNTLPRNIMSSIPTVWKFRCCFQQLLNWSSLPPSSQQSQKQAPSTIQKPGVPAVVHPCSHRCSFCGTIDSWNVSLSHWSLQSSHLALLKMTPSSIDWWCSNVPVCFAALQRSKCWNPYKLVLLDIPKGDLRFLMLRVWQEDWKDGFPRQRVTL